MGIPDNQLDDMIALSLQSGMVVTRRQKERAWERLRRRAVRQVMLVPYAVPPAPAQPILGWLDRVAAAVERALAWMLTEEGMYHRAAANRRAMPVTTVLGAGLVVHIYVPLYYSAY
ncbi:MAG: hypothetical protein K8J31_07475 [Anaerolineae bacterium]|nr:hypothetical protein [Anaerolineae bacterium]